MRYGADDTRRRTGSGPFPAPGDPQTLRSRPTEEPCSCPSGAKLEAFQKAHELGSLWDSEQDRADVLAFDVAGAHKWIVATGICNCSGMTFQPETGALWCVVNERDELGDDLPPDYATAIKDGAFYGWPWFYAGNHQGPRQKGLDPISPTKSQCQMFFLNHTRLRSGSRSTRARSFLQIIGERLRRHARFLEPGKTHRPQGGPAAVQGRKAT